MSDNDYITLVEASEEYNIAYSSLAEAARGRRSPGEEAHPRLQAIRSGVTWLTTRNWLADAIANGRIGRKRKNA